MIEIQLTKGYVAILDDCDADLAAFKWHSMENKKGYVYAARSVYPAGKRVLIRLHRLIVERKIGRPLEDGIFVDHINHNTLDNRRDNLRPATRYGNAQNQKQSVRNTSGYKGVRYRKRDNVWEAQISFNGKYQYLGRYTTPEEAYKIYCAAAEMIAGEFAFLPDADLVAKIKDIPIKRKVESIALAHGMSESELAAKLANELGTARKIADYLGIHNSSAEKLMRRHGYQNVKHKWIKTE